MVLLSRELYEIPEINRVTFQSLVKFLTNIAREAAVNKVSVRVRDR